MTQTPVLILGDSPASFSGLGRIARDLSTVLHSMAEFRPATLGRGCIQSRKIPFPQYVFPESDQWGEDHIERVWNNFSGGQDGILLAVWDISRVAFLGRPYPELGSLYRFLADKPFRTVIYCPVDSTGPNDRLSSLCADALRGFDKVVAYTQFGQGVLERSSGRRDIEFMPHGIADTWEPKDSKAARLAFGFKPEHLVLGMFGTNQARKQWPVFCSAVQQLRKRYRNVRAVMQTDVMARSHAWDMQALLADFGIGDITQIVLSGGLTDEDMAYLYSACDCTVLPSHEGWGYPLAESMACGRPAIHGDAGGGAELVPEQWRVPTQAWRVTGLYNSVAPVFDPLDWVAAIERVLDERPTPEYCMEQVQHLRWSELATVWRKLFRSWLCEDGR